MCYIRLSNVISEAWNIGGPQVYETQLKDKNNDVSFSSKLYLTQLEAEFDCDAFYPVKYLDSLECLEKSEPKLENDITYTFSTWNLM